MTHYSQALDELQIERYEVLLNEELLAQRYTWKTRFPDVFLVVKLFDPDQEEMATAKIFIGSYEKVKSHWNSLTPVGPDQADWEWAEKQLNLLIGVFKGEAPSGLEGAVPEEGHPVDSTKLKETLSSYDLVLAPAGIGKSALAESDPSTFVDGDQVIADSIGWPENPTWWKLPNARSVHEANQMIIETEAAITTRTVLFNGDFPSRLSGEISVCVWIADPKQLVAGANTPERMDAGRARMEHQDVQENVDMLLGIADRYGLPVYTGLLPGHPALGGVNGEA